MSLLSEGSTPGGTDGYALPRTHAPCYASLTLKAFYSDHFVLPLPDGHRFPMAKYALLREGVLEQGWVSEAELVEAPAASEAELLCAHSTEHVGRILTGSATREEMRRIGFPWSPELVERSVRSVGATVAAARSALVEGWAANLAGGTHHGFRDRGEGFCVFNDAAVAVRVLQSEGRIARAVVIDCDVHQGNGTAAIFHRDDTVFTFSIHGAGNYPFHKEESDLDIALPDGTGDAAYLEALDEGLERALSMAADLAVYVSGADPFAGDRLGRLSLSKDGLLERDRRVFARCQAAALPVVLTMAGGYAREVADTVDIHLGTFRAAREVLR